VFHIFAESHKIIASNIYDNVIDIYGLKLDKEKLLWGAIAPDILPQYRFIRHYQKESLNYIAREIMKIIFISRYVEFNKILDPLAMKILSKKIGIVSHYLSDFVCLPHADRWTFTKSRESLVKHVKYESALEEYAKKHSFKKNVISIEDINIYDVEFLGLHTKITEYIEDVVKEYKINTSFKNDMDFALGLNLKITCFILDTINSYSPEIHGQFAFGI
jgi:hypothetical protein